LCVKSLIVARKNGSVDDGRAIVAEVYTAQFLADWQDITSIRKPIIAAVSGYAVSPPFTLLNTHVLMRIASSAAGVNSR
jgi:enoyl-CoA hydratase/carnithine racemase